MKQAREGRTVPDIILAAHSSRLPDAFKHAAIARAYNILTGASLSHFDVVNLALDDYDDLIFLAERGSEILG